MKPNIVVEIFPDYTDPINPRKDCDNYGIMACSHGRYLLGDEEAKIKSTDFKSWDEVEKYLIRDMGAVVILPLWLYDHGGITISTQPFYGRAQHAQWDSMRVGFIYATRESIERMQSWKRLTKVRLAKVEDNLRVEVEIYDQYLTGDVYGYRISVDGEIIDSCYGFFGEELVKEEAITSAKRCTGRILEEALEVTYV
jgi:hypothetical protein